MPISLSGKIVPYGDFDMVDAKYVEGGAANKLGDNCLNLGIANGELLIAANTPISGEFARFTATGLEGRTLIQVAAEIDHDLLLNYFSTEHISHTGVSITGGEGLSGGGNILSSRVLDLDINSLSVDGSPDSAADYVVTYDSGAGTHKKVLLNVLPAGSGANVALSNLSSVAINTSLVSDTDNTDDLGTTTKKWRDLHLTGYVDLGGLKNNAWQRPYTYTLPDIIYPVVGNRFRLDDYIIKYSTNNLPVATNDCSGLTYNPITGTVFIIENLDETIFEFTVEGVHIRTITTTNFNDTEGITWMYGTTFAVTQERTAAPYIYIITIDSNTTTLNANDAIQITPDITITDNKGMEGLSFDSDNNWFYVAVEKQADGSNGGRVFKVEMDGTATEYTTLGTNLLAAGYNDLSDVYYDRESKHVFLLAQEQNMIIEADLDGTLIKTRVVEPMFGQPEGLSFSLDGSMMFIVGEADDFAYYIRHDANNLDVAFGNIVNTGDFSDGAGNNFTVLEAQTAYDHTLLTDNPHSTRDPDYLEYLLRDGSREITADWDAGEFDIDNKSFTVKDGSGDTIFFVDKDTLFFTDGISVSPEVGNPYGLLLLFTYPA